MEGLILKNITAGYERLNVLKNFNLAISPKEVLVLMGLSGAGKSTLLKTILGIVKPSHGSIFLHGHDITHLPIEQRRIGYVAQNYGLFPHLTVEENISYGLRIANVDEKTQRKSVAEMLNLIELEGYGKKSVLELSGGQQQRIALARALAVKPDLFLLDEPLSNIDQVTKFDVARDMKKLFDTLDIPIILVTHQYEDAQFFGAQVAVMVHGEIQQRGSYDELVKHPKSHFIKKLLTPFSHAGH